MNPAPEFPGANIRLIGGEHADNLIAQRCEDGSLLSVWIPTQEEREALASGAPVALWVYAVNPPPVKVGVFHGG